VTHRYSLDQLLSPWLLFGLALLLTNDLFLKRALGNTFTGKLSDVAGLFVFPLFWSALLPRWRGTIHLVTGIAFVLWKSPAAQPFIDAWNSLMPWRIGRTVDPTDLVALLVIPAAYLQASSAAAGTAPVRRPWRAAVVGIALFAFAATSYRTTFHYQQSYPSHVATARLVAHIDSLQMERFGPGGGRGDSMEVWIPSDRCFRHVYARMAVLPAQHGTEIRVSELEHHCPKQKGDSLDLLRIFEHCFLARLDSALAASAEESEGMASYATGAGEWGPKPRDSCEPRD